MEKIRKTFFLNFITLILALLLAAIIPLSRGYFWLQVTVILLFIFSYIMLTYFLIRLVKHCEADVSHLADLKFLLITILFVFATLYFLLASFDSSEKIIFGLRGYPKDKKIAIDGVLSFLDYMQDLFLTYFNSLYYSAVVMATLGDSGMGVKNIVPRIFVATQLIVTYSLIIFKLSEYFNDRSGIAAKESEDRIVNSIRSSLDCACCCCLSKTEKPRKTWRIFPWLK